MGTDVSNHSLETQFNHDGPLRILFAGRIARVRRVELILRAVSKLTIPFILTIVGGEETTSSTSKKGYMIELIRLVQKLGIETKVVFSGKKSREEMKNYYKNADVFVYPSTYENFGQPILEAAAYGLPIISTPVGVALELITSEETGYTIPADPNAICDRIIKLNDKHTRLDFGSKLRERVRQNFGWEPIIDQYIDLYRSLL